MVPSQEVRLVAGWKLLCLVLESTFQNIQLTAFVRQLPQKVCSVPVENILYAVGWSSAKTFVKLKKLLKSINVFLMSHKLPHTLSLQKNVYLKFKSVFNKQIYT
jgi:hypothetical protein